MTDMRERLYFLVKYDRNILLQKNYKKIYFVINDEFFTNFIYFLNKQIKYFYPLELCYNDFKFETKIISNDKNKKISILNFIKQEGKFDLYQIYITKTQKNNIKNKFLEFTRINSDKNFNELFFETLINEGIRLININFESNNIFENFYYKLTNNYSLDKIEYDIAQSRNFSFNKEIIYKDILDKIKKINLNKLKDNALCYKLFSINVSMYGINLF